jgi:hypothetical protein
VLTQVDYMFELGAIFRRTPVTRQSAALDRLHPEGR